MPKTKKKNSQKTNEFLEASRAALDLIDHFVDLQGETTEEEQRVIDRFQDALEKEEDLKRELYGVWLHNKTDSRDDEWVGVKAYSPEDAKERADYDSRRFSLGDSLPAKEFCKKMGIARSWLKDQDKK